MLIRILQTVYHYFNIPCHTSICSNYRFHETSHNKSSATLFLSRLSTAISTIPHRNIPLRPRLSAMPNTTSSHNPFSAVTYTLLHLSPTHPYTHNLSSPNSTSYHIPSPPYSHHIICPFEPSPATYFQNVLRPTYLFDTIFFSLTIWLIKWLTDYHFTGNNGILRVMFPHL